MPTWSLEIKNIKFNISESMTDRHIEEIKFFIFVSLSYIQLKEDEMGRGCSTNGEKRNAYRISVGKPEGKRPVEDQDVGG
jgi:hypothetical protein